jgi:hypothetical protein
VTVFIIPPRNVALEIGEQLLGNGKSVLAFGAAEVPMIAFACFVIEPKDALAVDDIGQPVLESVSRSRQGFRYSPENQFGEGVLRVDDPSAEKLSGLHVGNDANISAVLSTTTTER